MTYFWENPLASFDENVRWSSAYRRSLPDKSFLYIERARVSYRDRQGRSHPLNARHFPVRDHTGRIDCPHVRNAIARAPITVSLPQNVRRRVQTKARRLLDRSCPLPSR